MTGLKVFILPLSLAVFALALIFYVKPEYDEMRKAKTGAESNRQELQNLQQESVKLSELKNNFESMEEVKVISAALPENKSTEDYLVELYQRASRSGIALDSFDVSETPENSLTNICGASGQGSANSSGLAAADSALPAENGLEDTGAGLPGATVSPPCLGSVGFEVSVKGTWDQLLSFFRYLTDSNRIANIRKVDLSSTTSSGPEGQQPSDLISAKISLEAYAKPKSKSGNEELLGTLASGSGFNKEIIKKIQETVYAPYEPPLVSETGERNLFK